MSKISLDMKKIEIKVLLFGCLIFWITQYSGYGKELLILIFMALFAVAINLISKDFKEKFKPYYQITKLDVEKIIKENYDETYKKRD